MKKKTDNGKSVFQRFTGKGLDPEVIKSTWISCEFPIANGYSITQFERRIGVVGFFIYSSGTLLHFPDSEQDLISNTDYFNGANSLNANNSTGIFLRQYYNYGQYNLPFPMWTRTMMLGSATAAAKTVYIYYI
jgi:hypothetical protein